MLNTTGHNRANRTVRIGEGGDLGVVARARHPTRDEVALPLSYLEAEPGMGFEESGSFLDQAEDNRDAKGTAIEGEVGLIIVDLFRHLRDVLRRNVGRIADDQIGALEKAVVVEGREKITDVKLNAVIEPQMTCIAPRQVYGFRRKIGCEDPAVGLRMRQGQRQIPTSGAQVND